MITITEHPPALLGEVGARATHVGLPFPVPSVLPSSLLPLGLLSSLALYTASLALLALRIALFASA
jgi:hypothetical protein